MPTIIQPSFAAGEISPSLFGRVDLAKYHAGAALLRNHFVDYRGGVSNRAGTKFIGEIGDPDHPAVLKPFIFNTEQTYVLEFGHKYMRVIQNGEYITGRAMTATWFELLRLLPDWQQFEDADGNVVMTELYIRELVRLASTAGIDTIIIPYSGLQGYWFYPRASYPTDYETSTAGDFWHDKGGSPANVENFNPIEVILDEGHQNGMRVFVGLSNGGDLFLLGDLARYVLGLRPVSDLTFSATTGTNIQVLGTAATTFEANMVGRSIKPDAGGELLITSFVNGAEVRGDVVTALPGLTVAAEAWKVVFPDLGTAGRTALTLSAVSGSGVTVTAAKRCFAGGEVGKEFRSGAGRAIVTAVGDPGAEGGPDDFLYGQLTVDVSVAFPSTSLASGNWSIGDPIATRQTNALDAIRAEAAELIALYPDLDGLYIANEPVWLSSDVPNFYSPLTKTAGADPALRSYGKPIMAAPANLIDLPIDATDEEIETAGQNLYDSGIDIFANQFPSGAGFNFETLHYGWEAGQETTLEQLPTVMEKRKRAFDRARELTGTTLPESWSNIETWTMEGPAYGNDYPIDPDSLDGVLLRLVNISRAYFSRAAAYTWFGYVYAGTESLKPVDIYHGVTNYSTRARELYDAILALNGRTGTGEALAPYQIVTPYDSDDLPLIKLSQSNDVVTITHKDYRTRELSREDHDDWSLDLLSFDPEIEAPTGLAGTPSTAGTVRYAYVVTAVDAEGNESESTDPVRVSSIALGDSSGTHIIALSWNAVEGAVQYNVYKTYATSSAAPADATDALLGARFGLIGTTWALRFEDNNLGPDFSVQPPLHYDPFAPGQIESVAVTAGGAGYTSASVINISDTTGTGAVLAPVISGGSLRAVRVVKPGKNYIAPVLSVTVGAGATTTVTLTPAAGTFPALSGYSQQRKVYAATENEPARFWMSKPGLYDNFDSSVPTQDDDAITARLASQQANIIRSMTQVNTGLIMGTTGPSFLVTGTGGVLTPRTIVSQAQSFSGMSAALDPIVVNNDIYYVKALGAGIRSLSYNFYANAYVGSDLTALSNHLFFGRQIVSWTYADEPWKIVWAARDDGRFLSFTTLKEQEIYGWALHETKGLVESVCSIPEGTEDRLYMIVRRKIRGVWTRYTELMASRLFDSVEDGWFLDCAIDLPITPVLGSTLSAEAADGTDVLLTRSSGNFAVGDVGKVIRLGGGVAVIKEYVSARKVRADFMAPITALNPTTDLPLDGEWSMSTPVTSVSGLDHLDGETVGILGDGNVFPDAVVANGAVTLNRAASRIIVGLKYPVKGKSLAIAGDQVIQGSVKRVNGVTFRVEKTRGLWAGPTFEQMDEHKQRNNEQYGFPIQPFTGDIYMNTGSDWTSQGQFCWEVRDPLPVTVLGMMPNYTQGDDFRA